MSEGAPVPWKKRSRSKDGLNTEKVIVKKKGGRVHPRSGAGSIKDDGSTETEVIEVKDAMRSHTLKGSDLDALLKRAIRKHKEAKYIVYFTDANLTVEATVRRGKG